MRSRAFVFVISIFFVGCSAVQKDYDYMNSAQYQNREALKGSLVNPENGNLSEKSIQRLLSSRIKIPGSITLGVVRLDSEIGALGKAPIDDDVAKKFYNLKNWGDRVQSIVPVPSIMIKRPVSLKGLRATAALLQADMLLILSPQKVVDWKFRLFKENKAKSITALDVLLLDTRTGAVPYTFIAKEEAEILKEGTDYTNYELMERAKVESEKKALLSLAPKVRKFFKTIK